MEKLSNFTKKGKIRFIIFLLLTIVNYLFCTISLFFGNGFFIPAISFILLFIFIYFLSLDCYKIEFSKISFVIILLFIVETIIFTIFQGFSGYLLLEIFLFHATILSLILFLTRYLKKRTNFSAFSYFTEGGFLVTTLLTVFFCVLMMGKYTQIPFTCDEIESFPDKVVETTLNPIKQFRNKIIGFFSDEKVEENPLPKIQGLKYVNNPLEKSEELASADNVEQFFTNIRGYIKDQAQSIDMKNQISKTTCEYTISILQKVQESEGIQIAAIVLAYFLLVGIFKILLRIISFIGFCLFILLRLCRVYTYEKTTVEKEMIT